MMRKILAVLLVTAFFCVIQLAAEITTDKNKVLFLRFDEGSGLPKDSSMYGNDPTHSTITWTDGKSGKGAGFDGQTSLVIVPGNTESFKNITSEITIEAWIYPTADIAPEKAGYYGIVTKENVWSLFIHYGYPTFAIRVVGSGPEQFLYLRGNKGLTPNRWYHLAATYNSVSRTSKIYIDGTEVGVKTFEGYADYNIQTGNPESRVLIGRYLYNSNPFKGVIDEVKIYDKEKITFTMDSSATAPVNRETVINKILSPPVIDGRIDDKVWQEATVLKDFWKHTGESPAERQTVVYTGYDENAFYLAFRCFEDEPDKIRADTRLRDDANIFKDDCVEVFIAPTGRQDFYYHFAVNAAGALYDNLMGDRAPLRWDGDWIVATGREENAWTAEIKIPFYNLKFEKGINAWLFNLGRTRLRATEREVSSWSCTLGGFHQPEKFGVVKNINVPDDFFWEVRDFSISTYSAVPEGIAYNVNLIVKNNSSKEKSLTVDLEDIFKGHSVHSRTTEEFPAGREKQVNLSIPVSAMGNRELVLNIKDKQNRVLLRSLYNPASFPKLLDAYYERNYYTNEKVALLITKVNVDKELLKRLSCAIRVQNMDGNGVFSKNLPVRGKKEFVEIDIAKIPEGKYETKIELERVHGGTLDTKSASFEKRQFMEGEVKINQDKLSLVVDNDDFFLLGLWEGIAPTSIWDEISNAGFNTILAPSLTGRENEDISCFLNKARENNLKVILYAGQWGFKGFDGGVDRDVYIRESVPKTVSNFYRSPALLAWMSFDEPYRRIKPEISLNLYRIAKQHDPYHPIWTTFAKKIPDTEEWHDSCDILATDIYLRLSEGQTPDGVIPYVVKASEIAKNDRKVPVVVLMGQDWEFTNRAIMPHERICETYLACIYGAKGVAYWCNTPIVYRPLWEATKQMAKELHILSPVLLLPEECRISVKGNAISQGILHVLAKKLDDKLYIIVVNSNQGKVKAKFELSKDVVDMYDVDVMFEKRSLNLKEGKFFIDSFDKYERHVYVLPYKGDLSEDDFIQVALLDFQKEVKQELYRTLPNQPNILFNSSFEITTNPGWPDGWTKWCGFNPNNPAWFPRIGEKNSNFFIDADYSYHGKQSLALSATTAQQGYPCSVLQTFASPIESGKYVYSFYLRGDRENIPVKMFVRFESWGLGILEKIIYSTGEWQRYSFNIDVPPVRRAVFCGASILGEGTVWIDAVQLEKEESPTPYQPMEEVLIYNE